MYVVDASVWVSRFVLTDTHHQPSRRWLGRQVAREEIVMIPALALAEVAGAISRRTGRSDLGTRAIASLQRLPSARLIPVDVELAQLGAELAAGLHLRGADALYVAVARRWGVPLVMWGREQRERGQETIVARTSATEVSRR